MLPTKPNSDLRVSQADKPVLNSAHTVGANNPALQFASKAGKLIMKYPFWVLVVSSVGIHTAFALVTPNPLKKAEPPEVVVSTLPVVKLPPKSLTPNAKSNKSLFDNLFVKSDPKTGSSLNTFSNTFPNTSSNSLLRTLDSDSLDNLEGLPPVTDFSFSVPPLSSSTRETDLPPFVKSQTRVPETPQNRQRINTAGQIDNSNPVNTETANSNLKPEFRNGGLKDEKTSPSASKNAGNGKTPDKIAKSTQATGLTNGVKTDPNEKEKEIGNVLSLYTTDRQIIDLISKRSIVNTLIAPSETLISAPGPEREKGVVWIPAKLANVSGKSGSVTFMWLVEPNGEIQTRYLKSSGIKELDDIARDAAKDYKFQPIENSQSDKYRLVTATYKFS